MTQKQGKTDKKNNCNNYLKLYGLHRHQNNITKTHKDITILRFLSMGIDIIGETGVFFLLLVLCA